jgi:hypothetical protein
VAHSQTYRQTTLILVDEEDAIIWRAGRRQTDNEALNECLGDRELQSSWSCLESVCLPHNASSEDKKFDKCVGRV